MQVLQTRTDVEQSEIFGFGRKVIGWIADLNLKLLDFENIKFIPLPNIDTKDELKNAIIEDGVFPVEKGDIFENGGFDRILQSIENSLMYCQRVAQKSIGMILTKHKELENLS